MDIFTVLKEYHQETYGQTEDGADESSVLNGVGEGGGGGGGVVLAGGSGDGWTINIVIGSGVLVVGVLTL